MVISRYGFSPLREKQAVALYNSNTGGYRFKRRKCDDLLTFVFGGTEP
jgi:hypothetical protein